MYGNVDHEDQQNSRLILVTQRNIFLQKLSLYFRLLNVLFYILTYLTISQEEKSYTTSRVFILYTFCSILMSYVAYTKYKRDLLVVDHPVSMQFYASLLQLNKWPMSMLKLIPLLMLGIGIYFCTIFFVGCGQYVSGSYICIILRLVAIQELLVPAMYLFYCGCMLTLLCTVAGMHHARSQTQNQMAYYLGENFNITTVGGENNTNDSVCVICQSDTITGEQWKVLPCGHGYHPQCIDQWLIRNNTCPTCRIVIPTI